MAGVPGPNSGYPQSPPPPPIWPLASEDLTVFTVDSWGMRSLDKIMILQGVKLTILPLGVGHTNRPKSAQNGGVMYACLALI